MPSSRKKNPSQDVLIKFISICGIFDHFPSLLSTPDIALTEEVLHAMQMLLPIYPEYAIDVMDEKMFDEVERAFPGNNERLQELKKDFETFLQSKRIPFLPPCPYTLLH
ncbi:hypothetical protein KIN20_033776 [Parelaphostrongylus tenuis]|uniref:Uncharacterized protein n=1 Tax=Parelaphostrongylus tenuis TaxID=148309 RepID=A0AAD5R981_PARTN|nr:hypothetical protein KIN20_033776 [Parelaphostrongylus tenuis]